MSRPWAILVAAALLATPALARSKSRPPNGQQAKAVAASIQQAKALMAQGNRKQALAELDHALEIATTGAERREIESKRSLFTEQFITSESFQNFQEARGLAALERWDECLRELDSVGEKDRDNLLVLRQRADCQLSLKQYDAASKSLHEVLALVPGDTSATFSLAEISLATKQPPEGLALLQTVEPETSADIERLVILKAKLLEQGNRAAEALELLRHDQETHLDHIGVLYELGMLYSRLPGHDWPARKMLSLFITRCKRMKEAELKARRFDALLPQAQAALAAIDKKLGV